MSRLLCVATRGIVPHQAMGGFKRLSRRGRNPPGTGKGHRSGWGVGYFPGGRLRLVRETGDAFASVHFDEVSHMAGSNPDARILLAQLWSAPSLKTAERMEAIPPLPGTDGGGRQWLFGFDGDVGERKKTAEPYVVDMSKETPAERLRREILAAMPPPEGKSGPPHNAVAAAVANVLGATAEQYRFSHLNCVLTDGSKVYMARYADREAEWNEIHFCRMNRSILGCSEPLETVEAKWEPLANRHMLVFDSGLNMTKAAL
jgi:predicted glutamine amidotransferase